jgi:hypothetical protein
MVAPIPSTDSLKNNIAAEQAPANPPVKPEGAKAKTDAPKVDVVELSLPTQARLLKQQGMSIPQIAIQLKQDIGTVTGYFTKT